MATGTSALLPFRNPQNLYVDGDPGVYPGEQVELVPISSDKHLEYARAVKAKLDAAGLHAELDGETIR